MDVFECIWNMYQTGLHCDVTIHFENREINCHSIVLCSAVPSMKHLLSEAVPHPFDGKIHITIANDSNDLNKVDVQKAIHDIYAMLNLSESNDIVNKENRLKWELMLSFLPSSIIQGYLTLNRLFDFDFENINRYIFLNSLFCVIYIYDIFKDINYCN